MCVNIHFSLSTHMFKLYGIMVVGIWKLILLNRVGIDLKLRIPDTFSVP